MIPKLPKEFLWTDLDTMDEFFKLDPVNEDFYETFMIMREEPNYYQAGRFLTEVLNGKWFEEVRTHQRYTSKWRKAFVDALLASDYGRDIAKTREDKDKREPLKAYVVGCLKDAGVISGTYDGIARVMGYDEESYRSFSRNLGRGKNQDYFLWIKAYVEKSRLEQ